jgi:hypothetical protein
MPLVTGGADINKITVEIDGKVDDLLKDIKQVDKALDEFAASNKKAQQQSGLTAKGATASWTDFRSAYSTVLDVVRVGQQVWGATVGELVKYGDQVQKLSTITGQSAEETSRQIQMADDLRVSYETLARSLQFASKKGVDTSIDGLVRLGEEYKKLPKGIERTQFLMEKFGRSGIEMNKILGQTSEQIRDLAANTPDGLIITEDDLRDIRIYNQQVDELNDNWLAFRMNVAKTSVPKANAFLEWLIDPNKNADTAAEFINSFFAGTGIETAAHKAERLKKELEGSGAAAEEATADMEGLEDPLQTAEQAAKRLSSQMQALLGSMFKIQNETDRYNETLSNLAGKDAELAAEKNQLTLKMWEEQAAGKMTNDTYLEYVQRLDEITKKQAENAQATTKAKEDNAKASQQRVYDLVQERLAADGLIDTGEYKYLQELAVSKGLVTRAAADQAIAESNAADEYVSNFQKTQPLMTQTLTLMQQIAAYDGRVVQFGVNYSTTGSVAGYGSNQYNGSYTPINYGGTYHDMDSGGQGIAGQPYMIGTGAQPEMFVPNQSGQFYPNADKMGSNITITINNPVPQKSVNDIRVALKKLSYMGVAQ